MIKALEPYVIDFLLWRGYKYFLIETLNLPNFYTSVVLKPCFVKSEEENEDFYVDILKRDYIIEKNGHKEWMLVSIPDYEVIALKKWHIIHFRNCLIQN